MRTLQEKIKQRKTILEKNALKSISSIKFFLDDLKECIDSGDQIGSSNEFQVKANVLILELNSIAQLEWVINNQKRP